MSEGFRNTLWESKFQIFIGSMLPTPVDGWWFSSLNPEPPHFYKAFSALDQALELMVAKHGQHGCGSGI